MATTDPRIDAYIAKAPEPSRPILTKIRQLVEKLVPHATETISYQMPACRDKNIFLYFAAFKNHVGIYPPLKGDSFLIERLQKYSGPKGNLKFPYSEDMPYDLIAELIGALHLQYAPKK